MDARAALASLESIAGDMDAITAQEITEAVESLRAALDAARADEREACAALMDAEAERLEIVRQREGGRVAELATVRIAHAKDHARQIRARGAR